MEQLVNEVFDKLMDEEAILKLIEKLDLKDETLKRVTDLYENKKLIEMASVRLESIIDVVDCQLKPLKLNELKQGRRYIQIFNGAGYMYMLYVEQVNVRSVRIMYLKNDILINKCPFFGNSRGVSIYSISEHISNSCVFYEVKDKK